MESRARSFNRTSLSSELLLLRPYLGPVRPAERRRIYRVNKVVPCIEILVTTAILVNRGRTSRTSADDPVFPNGVLVGVVEFNSYLGTLDVVIENLTVSTSQDYTPSAGAYDLYLV